MTEPASDETPPAAPQEAPAEVIRKGGPKFFLLLTCGFLTLLCCLGSCVTGGTLGVVRAGNLGDTRVNLGTPPGWSTTDDSAWPWAAYATMSGPADPTAFEAWLTANGVTYDPTVVSACLAATEPCDIDATVAGRKVHITYHGGTQGTAELTVR